MSRIEGPTRAVDLFGVGKDGFKRGNPLTHDAATVVSDGWLNAQQEMPVRVIEDLSITVPTVALPDHDVLLRALDARGFLAATKNWKAPEFTFVGVCHGMGFARVPVPASGFDLDQWVMVGDATFDIAIFSDGDLRNWSTISSAIVHNDVIHAFGPGVGGRWIRVGAGGVIDSTSVAFATNINWTSRTSGTTENLLGLGIRGSTEVLGVGNDGDWVHSTDGVTWSTGSEGVGIAWKAVTWHDGLWYAVGIAGGGVNGIISTSSDHVIWSHDTSFTAHKFTDIVSDGTTVHAVTESGRVYSLIASVWTLVLDYSDQTMNSIDFDGAGYVICTEEGWVITAHQGDLGVPTDWKLRKPSFVNTDLRVVRAGAGRWITGGSGGDIVNVSEARY